MGYKMNGFPMIDGKSALKQKLTKKQINEDRNRLLDVPVIRADNTYVKTFIPTELAKNTSSYKPKHYFKQGGGIAPNNMWMIGAQPGVAASVRQGDYKAGKQAVSFYNNIFAAVAPIGPKGTSLGAFSIKPTITKGPKALQFISRPIVAGSLLAGGDELIQYQTKKVAGETRKEVGDIVKSDDYRYKQVVDYTKKTTGLDMNKMLNIRDDIQYDYAKSKGFKVGDRKNWNKTRENMNISFDPLRKQNSYYNDIQGEIADMYHGAGQDSTKTGHK